MTRIDLRALLLLGGTLLASCGGGPGSSSPDGPDFRPDLPPLPPAGKIEPVDLEPPPPFTLAPGDSVEIRVFRHPDLSLTYRVPQGGRVRYPLLGELEIVGKTPAELERFVTEALGRDYLTDPQVSVSVLQAVPRRVYIMGGVRSPREYEIPPDGRLTVLQAVGLAGGMTDDASRVEAVIERIEGDRRRRISVPMGDPACAGLFLRPGDVVVVPESSRAIYVLGAVNQPGTLRLPPSAKLSLVWAISQSGGFTKFAASGRVQVTRAAGAERGKVIVVDVDAILDGGTDQDIELRPGDIIFVPQRLF